MTRTKEELEKIINKIVDKACFQELTAQETEVFIEAQKEYAQILNEEITHEKETKRQAKKVFKKKEQRWKQAEDWWWKRLKPAGWIREGHIKRGISCPDFSCPLMILDVTKGKRKIPQWIKNETQDALLHAKDGKIAVVALHEQGSDMVNGFVIMTIRDFLALHIGGR